MLVRTEIYCHACKGFFWWDFEDDANGNYRLICPKCGHDHYRIVEKGVVTEARWGQSHFQAQSQQTWITVTSTASTYHTFQMDGTTSSSSYSLGAAWTSSTAYTTGTY